MPSQASSNVRVSNPDQPDDLAAKHLAEAQCAEAYLQFVVFRQNGRLEYRGLNNGVEVCDYTKIQKAFREHLAATEAHRIADPDARGGGSGTESANANNANSTNSTDGNGDTSSDAGIDVPSSHRTAAE